MQPRQFAPPAFAAALVGLAAASPFSAAARWGLGGLAGLYAGANLAAAASASRRRPSRLPLVSLAFGILHLSYGFGFLTGLVRFAGRWTEPRAALAPVRRAGESRMEGEA
jgi:hypothetical protein